MVLSLGFCIIFLFKGYAIHIFIDYPNIDFAILYVGEIEKGQARI